MLRVIPWLMLLISVLICPGCCSGVRYNGNLQWDSAVGHAIERFHDETGRWPATASEVQSRIDPEVASEMPKLARFQIRQMPSGGANVRFEMVHDPGTCAGYTSTVTVGEKIGTNS